MAIPAKSAAGTWTASIRSLQRRLYSGEQVPVSEDHDLQELKRKEEERYQLYQRAKDIWMRLASSERDAIRVAVKAKNPFHRDEKFFRLLEGLCINVIEKELQGEGRMGAKK